MNSLVAITEYPACHNGMPLLGLPAEQPAKKQLTPSVDQILQNIAEMIHEIVLEAIQTRTRAEFSAVLTRKFSQYAGLVRSFAEVLAARMPVQVVSRLSMDSLLEFEADLRANGEACFGPEMTERALFTVFTLRRITGLLSAIAQSTSPLTDSDLKKDHDFANNFLLHALVSRFCVDCLVVAMETKQPVYPDVLKQMDDCLRSVVDAYAWIRQAADLRLPKKHLGIALPPLDAEEQQLLDESMIDMARSHA